MTDSSIIIPTLNEEHFVGQLLADLEKQTLQPVEVLVVDGGSTDATRNVVKRFPFAKLLPTHSGVGHQREYGASKAKSDWFVFFDADVRIAPTFLADLAQQLTQSNLEAAVPRYISPQAHWHVRNTYHVFNVLFKLGEKVYPGGAGSCMICTKSVWKRVNGFQTDLLCDDLDFINKIGKKSRFAVLPLDIHVSDRRWRKYGFWSIISKYAQISWHYMRGDLQRTNAVEYEFGTFTDKR